MSQNILHEEDYILQRTKKLPINTLPSSDNLILTPTASIPIRLNSPHIPISELSLENRHHNERSTTSTPQLKSETISTGNTNFQIESPPPLTNSSSTTSNNNFMPVPFTNDLPQLLHKWTHTHSILCCISYQNLIYCGTQDGKVLIFDITTYSLRNEIIISDNQQSQSVSVLTLCLNYDGLLFVGGSDSLVRVYDQNQFTCKYIVYSLVDIGDIYSLAWNEENETLYIGAQNASILWCKLDNQINTVPNIENLPHFRYDKFFDSKGPGGIKNTLQTRHELLRKNSSNCEKTPILYQLIECNYDDIIRFAHNGYVYCLEFINSSIGDYNESSYLISGGGDGIVNIWSNKLKKIASLQNDESILSMCIYDSLLYVGLGDSNINVWDLMTLQMIRTFQCEDQEVLSLDIYNDSLYKACTGLYKMSMKSTDCIKMETEIINTTKIFTHESKTFLVAGGNKSLSLWDITDDKETEESSISTNSFKFSNDDLLIMLKKYISFKTISKYPELYLEDNRHCAQFLIRLFNNFGAYQTKLLPVKNGNPIVFAEFKKNNKNSDSHSRVLWYAHYDVVDATRHEAKEWKTDPFKLVAKEGNLYARGVSDNKGPTLASIFTVGELYNKQELNCDVVFIIEGEEECGSIGFQQVINESKNLIGEIDYIMLSNSYWLDDVTPCLNYGLRGVINASITIKSDKPDRHSGVDGGVSREPTMDMVHLLSSLMDPKTKDIKIKDFYKDVLKITKQEEELYDKIKNQLPNIDINSLQLKWRNPSLTIHKIQVSGPNNNTVIPQLVQSTISIRIVPNQDLNTIKENLINKLRKEFDELNSENHLSINIFYEADAWIGDPNNKVYQLLYKNLKKHWAMEPLFIREGGSIPSVRFLEKCFNAPAAQIPCGQSSDNAHLKDEKLRIINLFKLRSILTCTLKDL
ncbi:unnamed protein product [Candida verbasci]|uniref:Peptidase M20 dimerisation domain-containing protein n=1 Tax=Candida verbasci TaxID=1227364 RepID=A0A9W4TWG2_9ASCO|nr:unnamed protein product [Candida verbasci]